MANRTYRKGRCQAIGVTSSVGQQLRASTILGRTPHQILDNHKSNKAG
jgi:hypothetical protein